MDRLRAMRVVVGVADAGGFAPAARRLGVSAPSVTRAVSELEAHLGSRLLHRTTRTVQLTEAGARYVADCRRILAEIEDAERHAAGIHGAPAGPVSVTASVLFGRMMIAPILFDILDRYPDLSVNTLFVDRVVHVVNEGIDVAVRIAELPDSALTSIRVGTVRRVLCASPDYLDAHGRPRAPSELADHSLINFVNLTPGGEWHFVKDRRVIVHKPASRVRLNTADTAIAAAVAGRGIARLLSYMVAPQVASGALELVLEDHAPRPVPVHVMHKEPGQTSARVRAVVDHMVTALRGNPALDE